MVLGIQNLNLFIGTFEELSPQNTELMVQCFCKTEIYSGSSNKPRVNLRNQSVL